VRPETFCVVAGVVAIATCARAPQHVDLRAIPGQNILLVTVDTLRADALGSYGGRADTPALDRLAREGVRFDFAHAHAVVTLPSHASILTGQYPFRHGIRDNSGYRLPPDARTVASFFRQAGYSTAAFVSAFPLHSRFGLNRGFDVYDDRFGETRDPTEFVMPQRPASMVVPLARDWIRQHGSRPWLAWVHLFDPHAPYRPPPPFDAQYAGHPYDGEVAATDAALSPLFDDVRASGRPTLIVVTSDHGEALGEHGEISHGIFAYESTLRVPLIIAAANSGRGLAGGEVSHVPARHVDLLPTLLDAAALPPLPDLPGRSLIPASERAASGDERVAYFEAMSGTLNRGWAPLAGVIVGRTKFIDLPLAERYDLGADASEATNLIGRDVVRDRTLAGVLSSFAAARPADRVFEDPGARARLRSLGYVVASPPRKQTFSEVDDPKRLVALDGEVHRAVDAFVAGRVTDAESIYEQVLQARPDMAIAYRHLAFLRARRGDLDGAVDLLRHALASGATDRRIVTMLGEYLAESGRTAQAIEGLEPLSHDPDVDADLLNTLGIAYAQARQSDQAQRTFERVLAINPGSSVPLENLGTLALERGDLRSARARFEEALAVDPRSSRAHSGYGVVLQRIGEREHALDEWRTALRLDPTNLDALYDLGTGLASSARLAEARPFLEAFLRMAPPSRESDRREVQRLLAK
jgi:arylsulfatase A-like enzyme/Tfp pilus assembly protein PilF